MNPKAKNLMDQHDRKWLAERCVELDEFVELEISLKLEAVVKLTRLEAEIKKLERKNKALRANMPKSTLRRLDVQLGGE